MDTALEWGRLLVDLVTALAWPLVVLVVLYWLRSQLVDGVGRLVDRVPQLNTMRLKVGQVSLESEFAVLSGMREEIVEKIEVEAAESSRGVLLASVPPVSPSAIIVSSFDAVGEALRTAAQNAGIADPELTIVDARALAAQLASHRLLPPEIAEAVYTLDNLRQAAFANTYPGPTDEQAREYLSFAQAVTERIPLHPA
ncbi:hypothetical protein [Jiangella asiatica]|uniref:DUF4129 domain-containing protein n=1 Tax=Jiangella asiatica TaxID=2530372 RepID=A0A4R5CIT7_9ACTN|nr:hypothetical protein [Jiangella asiatica]TDD97254.1 hypothetical protein E1269_29845 [Jiangella asiatica]